LKRSGAEGGLPDMPGPLLLTDEQLDLLKGIQPEGPQLVQEYRKQHQRLDRFGGALGQAAMYEQEMELQLRLYATTYSNGRTTFAERLAEATPEELNNQVAFMMLETSPDQRELEHVRANPGTDGTDPKYRRAVAFQLIEKIKRGETLTDGDLSRITNAPGLQQRLRELRSGREGAMREVRTGMDRVGRSGFARSLMNEMRRDVSDQAMASVTRKAREGESPLAVKMERLRDGSLMLGQVRIADREMLARLPRETATAEDLDENQALSAEHPERFSEDNDHLRSGEVRALENDTDDALSTGTRLRKSPADGMGEGEAQADYERILQARDQQELYVTGRSGAVSNDEMRPDDRAMLAIFRVFRTSDRETATAMAEALGLKPQLEAALDPNSEVGWDQFDRRLYQIVQPLAAKAMAERVREGTRGVPGGNYDPDIDLDTLDLELGSVGGGRIGQVLGQDLADRFATQVAGSALQHSRSKELLNLRDHQKRNQFIDQFDNFTGAVAAQGERSANQLRQSTRGLVGMDQMSVQNRISSSHKMMMSIVAQLMYMLRMARGR
ncbi:MAG: hypothetical protein AAF658_02325, partial [Myxococcota bacterium]